MFDSKKYWQERYDNSGNSTVINNFVKQYKIEVGILYF